MDNLICGTNFFDNLECAIYHNPSLTNIQKNDTFKKSSAKFSITDDFQVRAI